MVAPVPFVFAHATNRKSGCAFLQVNCREKTIAVGYRGIKGESHAGITGIELVRNGQTATFKCQSKGCRLIARVCIKKAKQPRN